jgi:hypothetical protein
MIRTTDQEVAVGDGWVNWSGLATLVAEVSEALTEHLRRLLFDDPLDHTAYSAEERQTR